MQGQLFYLQDNRDYVGNLMLFWRKGCCGYTTKLNEAELFNKASAVIRHSTRESDIPWPKEYLESTANAEIDMQYVDIKKALKGTGIKIIKPKPPRKLRYNCFGCGRYMSEYQFYAENCKNCDTSNRP